MLKGIKKTIGILGLELLLGCAPAATNLPKEIRKLEPEKQVEYVHKQRMMHLINGDSVSYVNAHSDKEKQKAAEYYKDMQEYFAGKDLGEVIDTTKKVVMSSNWINKRAPQDYEYKEGDVLMEFEWYDPILPGVYSAIYRKNDGVWEIIYGN